jgi:ABC-2 type transport system permease protein|uniref:ABC transporter permease n=1 Tax=Desulfobacca acetoxidans TaxID=60893 RepID=A0A7C5ENY5_9BACT
MRFLTLFIIHLQRQLQTEMQYRTNLVVGLISQLTFTLLSVAFVGTFLKYGVSINGWSFWEMVFLFGMGDMTFGLSAIFVFRTFLIFDSRYIIEGQLDQLLVQPLHPLANLIFRNLDVTNLMVVLKGVLIVCIASGSLSLSWNFLKLTAFLVLTLGGALMYAGIYVFFCSLGFWWPRRTSFAWPILSLNYLTQYPLSIYPEGLQFFLSFIIPLGFAAFYPAQAFLGIHPGPRGYWIPFFVIPVAAALVWGVSWTVFRLGLDNYQSSGT